MAVLDIEKPCLGHSFRANVEDACWEGYECVADQWGFGAEGGEGVRGEVSFGGFEGSWVPMKVGVIWWSVTCGLKTDLLCRMRRIVRVGMFIGRVGRGCFIRFSWIWCLVKMIMGIEIGWGG